MTSDMLSALYEEFLRIWCHRWLALGVATVVFIGSATYVLSLSKIYEASAQLYVDKDTPLSAATQGVSLVGGSYGGTYVVQKTILDDRYLKPVLLKIRPAARSMDDAAMERALRAFRKKIDINSTGGNGFVEISYDDTNPVRARDVVALLLNQFISANVARNRADLGQALSFLDTQIASYARKLRAADARLAEFARRHPDIAHAGDPNYTSRAAKDVADARSAYMAALAKGGVGGGALEGEISKVRAKLASLRLRYTDKYPDVITAKRQLAQLLAAERESSPRSKQASPGIEAAWAKLVRAQARLRKSEEGPSDGSTLKAQWADLKKKDGILRNNYEEMLSRREATQMSQAIYGTKNSGKYQVTQPATVPALPSGPDRRLYLVLALAGSLAAGLAAAYIVGLVKGTLVAPRELEVKFGLPVAGTVAWEKAWQKKNPNRARARAAAAVVGLVIVAAAGILMVSGTEVFEGNSALRVISQPWLHNPSETPRLK